jgi:hypothetical protein
MAEEYRYYDVNPSPRDVAVDYILGIINDCTKLNCSEAETKLRDLEILLKIEKADKCVIEKIVSAKEILNQLKPYTEKINGYCDCLHKLEHTMFDIQNVFLDNYKKSA